MENWRKYTAFFLTGLMGGIVGTFLFGSFFINSDMFKRRLMSSIPFSYNSDLINTKESTSPTPSPLALPPADYWQNIAQESSLSTVAIQVFNNNKVIRQGSGVILSSDGLIVTTSDVVFPDSIYQVLHNDDILRATFMMRDFKKNLAILKVESSNLSVSDLRVGHQFKSGQDVLLQGKLINLSKQTTFSQRGLVNYVLENDIVIDTNFSPFLSGSKVLNSRGETIGVAYLRKNEVHLIKASIINDFLKIYLSK